MKKVSIAVSCIAALGLFASSANAGSHGGMKLSDANLGQTIGVTCFGCHGPNAVSLGLAPTLSDQPAADLATAMKEFRSGEREGTIMNRIAKGYTDADIAAVSAFLSGLK